MTTCKNKFYNYIRKKLVVKLKSIHFIRFHDNILDFISIIRNILTTLTTAMCFITVWIYSFAILSPLKSLLIYNNGIKEP